MKAEIVSVGTELLLGHITDTNAPYLAQHLSLLGIDCYYVSQLGDNLGRLVDHLHRAFDRSDLIVMTGGLGPTEDDLTREGISGLLGEPMVVQPELEAYLRAWFKRRGVEMPERNVKQATLIASAQALPNPLGTAPGWWVEKDGRIIVAMPGVPHEMYRMWEEEVMPRLRPFAGGIIFSRTLKVFGKGESAVEEAVVDYIHSANPTLATYAKDDGIHLRVTAKADSREQAAAMVEALEPKLRAILGDYIYGIDNQTMEEVVVGMLERAGKRVAIFDALSGGWLANLITNVRGISKVFPGGLVVELGALPSDLIPPEGAVSGEGANALAREARRHFGADIGLGLSGVGGPGEWGGKPAGTVFVALDSGASSRTQTAYYQTTRRNVKRLSAMMGLNLLRLHLLGIGE